MSSHGLTSELVLREAFDEATCSLRTTPSSNTSFSIELDAADGDNVTSKPDVALISTATAVSAVGMKTVNVYVDVGAAASVKLQVSGTDSGGTFIDVPSSTTIQGTMSGPLTICARRIQVVVVSGTPTFNLVMQSV